MFPMGCKHRDTARLLFSSFLVVAMAVLGTGCGGWSQKGEASWYGPGFAGRPTASGETFNPRDLTAAHKTLPLGTRIRVTNLDNGKSVVVRVNDRFPGTKGRVIDLSEASFERLAPKSKGVIKVKIEKLD